MHPERSIKYQTTTIPHLCFLDNLLNNGLVAIAVARREARSTSFGIIYPSSELRLQPSPTKADFELA